MGTAFEDIIKADLAQQVAKALPLFKDLVADAVKVWNINSGTVTHALTQSPSSTED
jgi:hypothetical protein